MPAAELPLTATTHRIEKFPLPELPAARFAVPALDPASSVSMRTRLERARRDVRRPMMTVLDYERLLGLVDQLLDTIEPLEGSSTVPTALPESAQLLTGAYRDLQVNHPRLIARCRSDLRASWFEFHGRRAATSVIAEPDAAHDDALSVFVVDDLDRHFPSPARGPIRHLLADATVAHPDGAGDRRLVVAPVWLHQMLVTFWPRRPTDASPLAPPLPRIGPATRCQLDDVDALAGLWSGDPSCEFFDPAAVLIAARLL